MNTAMAPIMDAEFAKGMAGAMKANPNMTVEQQEAAKKFGAMFAPIGLIVFLVILPFVMGGVIFLATKIVGGSIRYVQGVVIATFAMFRT